MPSIVLMETKVVLGRPASAGNIGCRQVHRPGSVVALMV